MLKKSLNSQINEWPPNYTNVFISRQERLRKIEAKDMYFHSFSYYSTHPIEFIEHWCITYDPRNAMSDTPALMPFILFDKQKELVEWLVCKVENQENGLVEKSRDMGATWVCAAFSVWIWLYKPGSSVGWGSRKEQLVDRLGDPDSIFEKIRMIIKYLPKFLQPKGFYEKDHLCFMKCINPANGATITGEGGDNIGRGGRKLIYFKDESAHYNKAESIEAALADNTNVQIDISSVNGAGNVFYRKRQSGMVDVFVMDWRDHPAKNDEWYNKRKAEAEATGLEHIFAQEVDRDYTSAVEGILIPAKYVNAAVDAHIKLNIDPVGERIIGLDVADEGRDSNAMAETHGFLLVSLDEWRQGDTGFTAKKAYNYAIEVNADKLLYDSIGVGAGVKAKTNELTKDLDIEVSFKVIGFNAGNSVVNPEKEYIKGKKNKDMFANLKAQVWWALRDRFYKTYMAIEHGEPIEPDEMISLSSKIKKLHDLKLELSRPKRDTDNLGRVKVESKKDMQKRGILSPNLAEALVMCFVPIKKTMINIG